MLTPARLAALMASDAPHAVLDLREKGAYERGHVFRATSLPRRLLEFRLPALVPAQATPIVLCDADGRLAELAAPTLRELGYTNIDALADGLAAWRAAGLPLVEGINVPSKVFGERILHELGTPEIVPGELLGRVERGDDLVIVDSRTPDEYARGCIPGAVNVPGGELVLRIGELVERPDTTIVVHCGGRTRSYVGAESLRRMKLPNPIVALENGTMGWALAGLPLERGADRWAPPVSPRSRARAADVARRVAAEDGVPFVAPDDLAARLARRGEENLYVLDVRTVEEYAAGHLPGAVWAPGGQVVQATDEYVAVRAGSIVLVCDDLVRSVMTAAWLRRMGFPRVGALAGGVPAWEQAGGALERGRTTVAPAGWERARAQVRGVKPGDLAGALVLDVDQSDAYTRGHVPDAAWLCRSRLELLIAGIAPDARQPIVVSCGDGVASTLAAATLGRLGYDAVRVLEGGTRAWAEAGLPLERGAGRLLDEPDDIVPKPYERGREAMVKYLRWEEALDERGRSPYGLL